MKTKLLFYSIYLIFFFLSICLSSSGWTLFNDEYYQINWAIVPETQIALSSEQVDTFGICTCDLTKNKCDKNCCCDPDCSQNDLSRFTECLPSTSNPGYKDYKCIDNWQLLLYNTLNTLPSWIKVERKTTPWPLFCVYYSGSASQGRYYSTLSDLTSIDSITEEVNKEKVNTYRKIISFFEMYPKAATDQIAVIQKDQNTDKRYYSNFRIVTGTKSGAVVDLKNPKYLVTPSTSTFSSACIDTSYTKFNSPAKTIECDRKVTTSVCTNQLNYQTLFVDRVIAKKFLTDYTLAYSSNDFITISIEKIQNKTIDHSTGKETYINLDSAVQYPSSVSNGLCLNSVIGIEYFIIYDSDSFLTDVKANVVISDIGIDSFVKTSVIVHYLNTTNTKLETGEIRDKSGNPGYQRGKPILSGHKATSTVSPTVEKNAIYQSKSGLFIYKGLNCEQKNKHEIGFNQNVVSGCKLSLSQAELQSLCTNSKNIRIPIINDLFNDTYVGRFGNSELSNFNQWVPIQTNTVRPVPNWDSVNLMCKYIPSVLEYQFIIAKSGSVLNEQWKIIGVMRSEKSETWTFDQTKTKTDFWVQFRVRFIKVNSQNVNHITYPIPSLLPTLPDDIFYPFKLFG